MINSAKDYVVSFKSVYRASEDGADDPAIRRMRSDVKLHLFIIKVPFLELMNF